MQQGNCSKSLEVPISLLTNEEVRPVALRSQPIWDLPEISSLLSHHYDIIRDEVTQLLSHPDRDQLKSFDEVKKSIRGGSWNVYYFVEEGDVHEEFTRLLPRTTQVLMTLPLCRSSFGYSYISLLSPRGEITPHHGVTNTKLRIQLPIMNVNDSIIGVAGREYRYEEGKALIFDDSYEHWVMNKSETRCRVVMLIDIWHPDLSVTMIDGLMKQYPSPDTSVHRSMMNIIRIDARSAPQRNYDFLFKILFIGTSYVGKSSFILRFVDDEFVSQYFATIGVDFKIRTVEVDNKIVKLQLWEPTGPERFRAITRAYYRGAHAVMLLYDISSRESFEELRRHWGPEAQTNVNEGTLFVVIGTKSDLTPNNDLNHPNSTTQEMKREVAYEEGEALCRELGALFFMECSSKTGENVENILIHTVGTILKRPYPPPDSVRIVASDPTAVRRESCVSL